MAVQLHEINQRVADALGIDTKDVTHITLHFDAVGLPTAEVTHLIGLDDNGEQIETVLLRFRLVETDPEPETIG